MPFEKGHKKIGGKAKGSKNERTKQWEQLGDFITQEGAVKFVEETKKLEGLDYVNAYSKIISYFKPQLNRTEIKEEGNKTIIVKMPDEKEND